MVNYYETGGIFHSKFSSGDCNDPVFKRLAKHFKNGSFELGKFVKKKNSVVGQ